MKKTARELKRVCVFCGSSPGRRPEYAAAARSLGGELAARNIGLVFGGGRVGLMGMLAEAVLAGGGQVTGVIPCRLFEREVALTTLADLRVVGTMHERKAQMAKLADAFIALPGGLGTVEEFFEMLTWTQLGLQSKPCGLLNAAGYYDRLLAFLDHAMAEGFVPGSSRGLVLAASEPAQLLDEFAAWVPPGHDMAAWALAQSKTKR